MSDLLGLLPLGDLLTHKDFLEARLFQGHLLLLLKGKQQVLGLVHPASSWLIRLGKLLNLEYLFAGGFQRHLLLFDYFLAVEDFWRFSLHLR